MIVPQPRCKHNMDARFCAACLPPAPKPVRAPIGGTHHAKTPRQAEQQLGHTFTGTNMGYAVVRTNRGRGHSSFNEVGSNTRKVHFDGFPFVWAIEDVLARAPNLVEIELVPTMMRHVTDGRQSLKLLLDRGVKLTAGYHRPELAWGDGRENRSAHYKQLRARLMRLDEVGKRAFDELCVMGFEAALYARRYFCLNGEEYQPYHALSDSFGFNSRLDHAVSAYINGVIHYLDPSYQTTNSRSLQFAATLRKRVVHIRAMTESEEKRRALFERLGIDSLPDGLAIARIELLSQVMAAHRDGKIDAIEDDRERTIVRERFGLGRVPIPTLSELGEKMAVSRERVRQIEANALKRLGISDEEDLS